jgi:sugar phosphate isomerase/epimerase
LSPLGVAHLTALELPPPVFVREAAKAGFASVGFRIAPAAPGAIEYPLKKGTRAQQELRGILQGEGVRLYDVEFIPLTPEVDVFSYAGLLEAAADLGAVSVNVSGDDPDFPRLTQTFATMCELAGSFGMRVDLEFMRWRVSANLHDAVRLVSAAGRPNGAILLDCLHLDRSGSKPTELRDVPAGFIRVAQLCDASPRKPVTDAEVIAEARQGRLPPGEGNLPLIEIARTLPSDTAFTVEVPIPAMDAPSRLALNYKAARAVLTTAGR